MNESFNDVLSAAIADMIEHGFDSVERVQHWTRLLRAAAERSLISPESLEQQLRDGLATMYRRMVDHDGVLKHHPGVERFTYENLKPQLRGELDRRIMASASLIRLNRGEAIDKTVRRFEGWSTSIPKGGVSSEKRRDVKDNVRKALASLPFEERRVLIDQGHKLVAAISEIVATDGGAIALRWRSHYRQPGYNYREDHKERDDKVYLIRDSWAHQQGLVKRGRNPYYDEITATGQEPFCRCYAIYIYNLRDLPDDMITQDGRRALVEIGTRRSTTGGFARADAMSIFSPSKEAAKSVVPVPVDRDHDVLSLGAVPEDCSRLFVHRGLPRALELNGATVDPAGILWARESARWLAAARLTAAFLESQLRRPIPEEASAIAERARGAASEAEHAICARLKVDGAWQAWAAREAALVAGRDLTRLAPVRIAA